jgi:iron complex transport system ATP-binding protein
LSCRDLEVRRGGRAVLSGLTLAIACDECVSVVGPNGSGKTTLLLALGGLFKPSRGNVQIGRIALGDFAARDRAQLFAYVPQVLERTPTFTVWNVVAGGRFPHLGALRSLSAGDKAIVQAALRSCGLEPLVDRRFDALSGGERQKTLIAAAMAQDAQMLLLDEPSTALDPAYQLELVEILRRWHRSGRGLLIVSHDLQLPAALGGRVIALRNGRIAADGPAEHVLDARVLDQVYGVPVDVRTPPTWPAR